VPKKYKKYKKLTVFGSVELNYKSLGLQTPTLSSDGTNHKLKFQQTVNVWVKGNIKLKVPIVDPIGFNINRGGGSTFWTPQVSFSCDCEAEK